MGKKSIMNGMHSPVFAASGATLAAMTATAAMSRIMRRRKGPAEKVGSTLDNAVERISRDLEHRATAMRRDFRQHPMERMGRTLDRAIDRVKAGWQSRKH